MGSDVMGKFYRPGTFENGIYNRRLVEDDHFIPFRPVESMSTEESEAYESIICKQNKKHQIRFCNISFGVSTLYATCAIFNGMDENLALRNAILAGIGSYIVLSGLRFNK